MAENDVPSCSSLRKFQTEYPDERSDQTKPIKLKIGETSKGAERQEVVSGVEILFPNVVGTSSLESSDLMIDDELADPGRASKLRPKTPELDDEQERGDSPNETAT